MRMWFCFVMLFAGVAPASGAEGVGAPAAKEPAKKVIYPENQTIDFEGLSLEGELKTPGEFYFQNRNQERFDSLTKRRVNFRREMLRDSIQSN
jgi:hypothetical protein